MSTPKFATTYNLIAFLEKPSESDGFEQIVDFQNANQIKYALMRKHKPRRKKRMETKVSPTKTNTKEHVPTPSNDPLPSGEDRIPLKELMKLCTNLSNKVLDLESEVIEMKSSHKANIEELESRVKKLEKEESSKQERKIADNNADAEVNLENVYNLDMAHEETVLSMQDVDVKSERIEDVVKDVEDVVATTETVKAKPKAKGVTMQEPKPEMPLTRKDQIALDEEVARGLEAEWNANMKDNIDWNEVVEPVQSRQSDVVRKCQALKRKPMLVAQARKNMMIYLKNMAGYKMDYFKGMSYEQIRPIFEIEYNKDNAKKQKLEEQEEAEELKNNLELVPDDEDDVFVNVTRLSSKPITIMDYKIYKEGKKEHFQIFRANGNHQMYLAFNTMLKNFDREDLKVLWKIVKDRFKNSRPKEVLDVFLWHTLKVMFEHTVEDNVWKHQKGPQGLARVKI
nr:hypothetical protein [Tanacetum cinerariifolium]